MSRWWRRSLWKLITIDDVVTEGDSTDGQGSWEFMVLPRKCEELRAEGLCEPWSQVRQVLLVLQLVSGKRTCWRGSCGKMRVFLADFRWKRMQIYEKYEWKWDERDRSFQQQERRNSQGEVHQNLEKNRQGGVLSTLEANSQREDPRTFKDPVERWRVQEKQKEEKWKRKKKKKGKEEKCEVQKADLVEKVQRQDGKFPYSRAERRRGSEER